MICPNCGQPLPDTAKMCYSCKTKLDAKTVEPTPNQLTPQTKLLCVLGLIGCVILIILGIYLASSPSQNPFDYFSP